MHRISLFLLFTVGSLAVPACAQKTHPQQAAVAPATAQETGPVLTFERTPCFGTCPGYSMQVYADGRVAYAGTRAVPLMDERTLRLPPATVAALRQQAQEAHFDQFQNKYMSGATDLPSTIVGVRQPNGELKTVVAEGHVPDNVRQLFAAFGNEFDALAQLNITSDK